MNGGMAANKQRVVTYTSMKERQDQILGRCSTVEVPVEEALCGLSDRCDWLRTVHDHLTGVQGTMPAQILLREATLLQLDQRAIDSYGNLSYWARFEAAIPSQEQLMAWVSTFDDSLTLVDSTYGKEHRVIFRGVFCCRNSGVNQRGVCSSDMSSPSAPGCLTSLHATIYTPRHCVTACRMRPCELTVFFSHSPQHEPSAKRRRVDSAGPSEPHIGAVATAYVRDQMNSATDIDGSHDFNHIERVIRLTERIARAQGLSDYQVETAVVAAALHDIGDVKYAGTEDKGQKRLTEALNFLTARGCDATRAQRIEQIVRRVGFKEELAGGSFREDNTQIYPELPCVQDADKLDAIGAVGVARCFAYSGKVCAPLYDPDVPITSSKPESKEAYLGTTSDVKETDPDSAEGEKEPLTASVSTSSRGTKNRKSPALNHFYEKLLHLSGMMRTEEGRRLALARHKFMLDFLEQFNLEMLGKA